jgi:hypothetical protein
MKAEVGSHSTGFLSRPEVANRICGGSLDLGGDRPGTLDAVRHRPRRQRQWRPLASERPGDLGLPNHAYQRDLGQDVNLGAADRREQSLTGQQEDLARFEVVGLRRSDPAAAGGVEHMRYCAALIGVDDKSAEVGPGAGLKARLLHELPAVPLGTRLRRPRDDRRGTRGRPGASRAGTVDRR